MYTLFINLINRTEYYKTSSAWAGNLIAINLMKANAQIKSVELVNNETGEIEKTFIR